MIAYCLERLAAVAEEQEADEAARLLGSAEQLRATVQAPPDAFELEERELTAATARRRLGDEGFSTAFSERRAMSPEEAVLYASGVARKLAEE